jgi:hypothetical protein
MRAILFALAFLAVPAAASAQSNEAFNLSIEVGRWGAMLSSVEDHRPNLQPPQAGDPEYATPRALARRLRETVWELNLMRSRLCAEGRVTRVSCRPAFTPSWLSKPPDEAPSLYTLEQRSAALGREVSPLWNAVCAEIEARVADPEERRLVCPME